MPMSRVRCATKYAMTPYTPTTDRINAAAANRPTTTVRYRGDVSDNGDEVVSRCQIGDREIRIQLVHGLPQRTGEQCRIA